MNILMLVPFKERHLARIREAAGDGATFEFVTPNRTIPLDTKQLEALRRADVVIGEPAPKFLHDEEVNVKWVQMTWAGTDLYTRGYLKFPDGMALTNVAGTAYGHIVSQYVVGQILAITQNLAAYTLQQQTMSWNDLGPNMTLQGTTVLVYGAGDIGQHVARRLSGFDVARIIGVCRNPETPREGFDELVTLPRAETLLPQADIVVGCIPNVPETVGYFGARRLRLMKKGSVLINVGRGNFVDCNALAAVLNEGHLRGAALDVTEPEPLPLHHDLWRNNRCIVTPHISGGAFGHSDVTEDLICDVCCDNLRRFRAGEELVHRVL